MTRTVRDLALAGIRLRHPGITDEDARRHLAATTVDPRFLAGAVARRSSRDGA
jgi:hypothetical protein